MPTVHDVANYFLVLAARKSSGVTHMKLQKLCYYAQGFTLGMRGQRLFDARFRAWEYGPVCYDLWRRFQYRRDVLSAPNDFDPDALDEDTRSLIEMVDARFSGYSAMQLSKLTHREQPWRDAFQRAREHGSDEIADESMQRFFAPRIDQLDVCEAPPPADHDRVRALLQAHPEWAAETEASLQALG